MNQDTILVLSSLGVVMMALESTVHMDMAHIIKRFLHVLKFCIIHFLLCVYALTLAVYALFDFPGKGFEVFVLSMLLSILIYGTDATIVMEFFKEKKSRAKEILEMEGIISGPMVVLFAFFLMNYLQLQTSSFSTAAIHQTGTFLEKTALGILLSIALAYLCAQLLRRFNFESELRALFVIAMGIIALVAGEAIKTDGSLAVVFFGIFIGVFERERMSNMYNTMLAHLIYIILFIALGMQFSFPDLKFWIKGFGLFVFYLLLRFASVLILLRETTLGEKIFITLNAAKGIEVVVALFILSVGFKHVAALQMIASLGFLIMIFSYVTSTLTNHYGDRLLERKIGKKRIILQSSTKD